MVLKKNCFLNIVILIKKEKKEEELLLLINVCRNYVI